MASNAALLCFFHYQTRAWNFHAYFSSQVTEVKDHIRMMMKLFRPADWENIKGYLDQLKDQSLMWSYVNVLAEEDIVTALVSKDWYSSQELLSERISTFERFRETFESRYLCIESHLFFGRRHLAHQWLKDYELIPPTLYFWGLWKYLETLIASLKYLTKCLDTHLKSNSLSMMNVQQAMEVDYEVKPIRYSRKRKIMEDLGLLRDE